MAESRYGRLDVLINNAGIARPENVEDTTEELWERVMSINTTGVFLGTRKAIPAMRRAGGGSIINLSSVAGLVGRRWAGAAYSASKGAVLIFSKATAVQYAPDKIRCNSIHPGPIQTPMLGITDDDPALMATRTAEIPLGRIGTTDDVANGALFLASDESSWITGIELTIDGGITAQ